MADGQEDFSGTTASSAAAPVPDGNPWHHDLDADAKGWLASKGWDKLDAKGAVTAAVQSYRQAEKLVGGDPASLLRAPRPDAPPAEIAAFWQKLGAPDKPEGYDFSGIKHADGAALDADFVGFLRQTASELHLPSSAAFEIAKRFAAMADTAEADETAANGRALAEAKGALATNWGGADSIQYKTNLAVAQRAALASGVTTDELNAIEGSIGYPKIMAAFLKMGVGMGEHRALTGGSGTQLNADGTPVPMSVDEARSKITSFKADTAWRDRWSKGGIKEANELQDALDIIVRNGQRVNV
jgi:hypothetical protein